MKQVSVNFADLIISPPPKPSKYMHLDLPWGNHPSPALSPHDSRGADADPWVAWV